MKKAAVCHFAIQHEELRQALLQDGTIEEGFVQRVFQDIDSPRKKGEISYLASLSKAIKATTISTPTKKPKFKSRPRKQLKTVNYKVVRIGRVTEAEFYAQSKPIDYTPKHLPGSHIVRINKHQLLAMMKSQPK